MLKFLIILFSIISCKCMSQTLQTDERYQPIDLIGDWEYQIPNTNDYIGFQFTIQFGIVNGEFFKYSKDVNGQIAAITFDSRADTINGAMSNEAMGAIDRYQGIAGINTFGTMFIDAGVTNNNPQIRLNQLATLRLFRPCTSCNLFLEFNLLPKNPSVNPYDQEYTINIPSTMVLIKI